MRVLDPAASRGARRIVLEDAVCTEGIDERRRIAADLHDFVGQNLTALGIGLETLRSAAPPQAAKLRRALPSPG